MNWIDLISFKGSCERAGIEVPTAIIRGLELIDLAKLQTTPPSSRLLELRDAAVSGYITDLSIRTHQGYTAASLGMSAGVEEFTDQLLREVREASLPEIDRLIAELRPKFEGLAAPLVTAAQTYGFTLQTTSDSVIDLANEKASTAWRDARAAWQAILPLVRLRIQISEAFKVSPTREETNQLFFTSGIFDTGPLSSNPMDYSVCFAAGDNWSYDGAYAVSQKTGSGIDWFALAAGGLTLNTTAQVREKQERKSLFAPRVVAPDGDEPAPSFSHAAMLPRYGN